MATTVVLALARMAVIATVRFNIGMLAAFWGRKHKGERAAT